jgi:hypothetical protein
MNAILPRMDGMSEDGLSYSVASDFDKQMAQALAEYEARTKSPRYIPGGVTPQPDAPDLLKHELLDPIIMARNAKLGILANQPERIISHQGDIFGVNPLTGHTTQLVTAPPKAVNPNTPDWRTVQKTKILDSEIKLLNKELTDPFTKSNRKAEIPDLLNQKHKEWNALLEPKGAPVLPTAPPPTPHAFMGTPGGQNLIQDGMGAIAPTGTHYPTRAQAAAFVKAHGANARSALQQAGFDPSGYAD